MFECCFNCRQLSAHVQSVPNVCLTLQSTAFCRGVMAWLLQALSMAEIVSSLPSSGGPYFWAIHLAPKKGRSPAFAGWMTGVQHAAPQHTFLSPLKSPYHSLYA